MSHSQVTSQRAQLCTQCLGAARLAAPGGAQQGSGEGSGGGAIHPRHPEPRMAWCLGATAQALCCLVQGMGQRPSRPLGDWGSQGRPGHPWGPLRGRSCKGPLLERPGLGQLRGPSRQARPRDSGLCCPGATGPFFSAPPPRRPARCSSPAPRVCGLPPASPLSCLASPAIGHYLGQSAPASRAGSCPGRSSPLHPLPSAETKAEQPVNRFAFPLTRRLLFPIFPRLHFPLRLSWGPCIPGLGAWAALPGCWPSYPLGDQPSLQGRPAGCATGAGRQGSGLPHPRWLRP